MHGYRSTLIAALGAAAMTVGLAIPVAAAGPTVCPEGCQFTSIQAAIDASAPGSTIRIGPGTYAEDLVVSRPVKLVGAGDATILHPATSRPNPCTGSSLCGGAATNVILVRADNVTIADLVVDGHNPALAPSGIVRGGVDLNARNGIITDHRHGTFQNLTVERVAVRNIYLRGLYASSGGSFRFAQNRVANVQGDSYSIAIFNFGGRGAMVGNRVTAASDGLASNHSGGVTLVDNEVSASASGIHTDNAGDGGGPADVIEGNRVRDCTAGGYGIFVFVPYAGPTVASNVVSGCSVALALFGQGGAVTTLFSDNQLSGAGGGAGSVGAYLTTDELGYGATPAVARLEDNTWRDFDIAVQVVQTAGQPVSVALHRNNLERSRVSALDSNASQAIDATDNWWGCRLGAGGAEAACGHVTVSASVTPFSSHPFPAR